MLIALMQTLLLSLQAQTPNPVATSASTLSVSAGCFFFDILLSKDQF
jgi:hypothetical protein